MSRGDAFWEKYPPSREAEDELVKSEMWSLLRKCYEVSRKGCFSRKRSERDAALAEINRITEKYK